MKKIAIWGVGGCGSNIADLMRKSNDWEASQLTYIDSCLFRSDRDTEQGTLFGEGLYFYLSYKERILTAHTLHNFDAVAKAVSSPTARDSILHELQKYDAVIFISGTGGNMLAASSWLKLAQENAMPAHLFISGPLKYEEGSFTPQQIAEIKRVKLLDGVTFIDSADLPLEKTSIPELLKLMDRKVMESVLETVKAI